MYLKEILFYRWYNCCCGVVVVITLVLTRFWATLHVLVLLLNFWNICFYHKLNYKKLFIAINYFFYFLL